MKKICEEDFEMELHHRGSKRYITLLSRRSDASYSRSKTILFSFGSSPLKAMKQITFHA